MRYKHTNRNGFLLGFIDFFTFGVLLLGPMVATKRFFDTLNKVESELNRQRRQTTPEVI